MRLHAWGWTWTKKCSKVSAGIGATKRIKPYVPPATLQISTALYWFLFLWLGLSLEPV